MSIQTEARISDLIQRLMALELQLRSLEKRLEALESARSTLTLKKGK